MIPVWMTMVLGNTCRRTVGAGDRMIGRGDTVTHGAWDFSESEVGVIFRVGAGAGIRESGFVATGMAGAVGTSMAAFTDTPATTDFAAHLVLERAGVA